MEEIITRFKECLKSMENPWQLVFPPLSELQVPAWRTGAALAGPEQGLSSARGPVCSNGSHRHAPPHSPLLVLPTQTKSFLTKSRFCGS